MPVYGPKVKCQRCGRPTTNPTGVCGRHPHDRAARLALRAAIIENRKATS